MIFIGILLSIAAIGFLCWLLFTLAVFALPFFAGVTAGTWAYGTGAGWLGAIVVGFFAAGLTFGIGQFLLATVRPTSAVYGGSAVLSTDSDATSIRRIGRAAMRPSRNSARAATSGSSGMPPVCAQQRVGVLG